MSIFDQVSTPVESSPEMDTELDTAEQFENQEESYEEEQYEEQEEEQTEEEEESDPEDDGHSEKLLAGKYKTPEDLETAYIELQRAFTKQRMAEKSQQPQQQPIQQQDEEIDFNDPVSIINAINADPVKTIAKIAEQTYQQARTMETQEQAFQRGISEVADTYKDFLKSDDDMGLYFDKVGEICRELGVNVKTPSQRILKLAASELWGDPNKETISKVYQQAVAKGRAEAEQARKMKAGLSAPNNTKPKEKPKTAEELIADSIVLAGSRKGIFG